MGPFLIALDRLSAYFQNRGLDLAKDGISLPSLALKDLFANIDTFFSLVKSKDEDLYRLMKDNIVGGPPLIFHRHHMAGETKIREVEFAENAKMCGGVVGFDVTALYLGCIMMPMPTGFYTRRREENRFLAEPSNKYGIQAREWLTWYE